MYRKNVAALIRCQGQYVACFRSDYASWQSVQGGVEPFDASLEDALGRELNEELGISPQNFKILYQSKSWRRYLFPSDAGQRQKREASDPSKAHYIGQEQLWFLIEIPDISCIHLEKSLGEFSRVELFSIEHFLSVYSPWKQDIFHDFCHEIGLCP
jgi:8-oxo-dGTP pyrophosphatase MutT (NUDIX family)